MMINYQLNMDGLYACKSVDGVQSNEWVSVSHNSEYLAWLSEGNTPNPYVAPPAPPEPTITEKLASVGLTIDDLKTALGIK